MYAPDSCGMNSPEALRSLIGRVRERLYKFDPLSLIRVLQNAGIPLERIEFRSHHSRASQARLIQTIDVVDDGLVIFFNLGLLSAQSPIPSYFFKEMDLGHIDTQAFEDFIGFFDHILIKLHLSCIYPELNEFLFPDWRASQRRNLHLKNLRSTEGLYWLFDLVFPECCIRVEKAPMDRQLQTGELRLGAFELGGNAVLGQMASVEVLGLSITIEVDNEMTSTGIPWFKVIRTRMDEVIEPILNDVGVDLELVLEIREMGSAARLAGLSYLGYDPLAGGEVSTRRMVLFRGQFCD
ncbi:MAG: hypothetical protein VX589_18320 [Myxococcota bacterium]|nr:hypothetical protein [Myxococcota bacterium]